jgi:hypothetical protein
MRSGEHDAYRPPSRQLPSPTRRLVIMHRSSRSVSRRLAALLSVGVVAAIAPAAASAATVAVPGQCYVYWPGEGSQKIPVSVSGLTPSENVKLTLEVDGQAVSGLPSLTADSTGSIVTELSSWTSGLGTGPTSSTPSRIIINDVATGAELGTADFKVANVAIKVDGAAKSLGIKRVWEVSGLSVLSPENTYWAHYFKNKKEIGKQRLGQATDACGYIRVKKLLVPFKKYGTFEVRVQASKKFNGDLSWIGGTVQAYKVYRR